MEDSILYCARCKGENLHQEQTRVFMRPEEDGPVTVMTSARNGDSFHGPDINNENPSSRRDGLIVYFSCENCSHETKLKIYQHKGTTYMEVE